MGKKIRKKTKDKNKRLEIKIVEKTRKIYKHITHF